MPKGTLLGDPLRGQTWVPLQVPRQQAIPPSMPQDLQRQQHPRHRQTWLHPTVPCKTGPGAGTNCPALQKRQQAGPLYTLTSPMVLRPQCRAILYIYIILECVSHNTEYTVATFYLGLDSLSETPDFTFSLEGAGTYVCQSSFLRILPSFPVSAPSDTS